MNDQQTAMNTQQEKLKEALYERYLPGGCWRGRLSSSALSTAVGLFALALVDEVKYEGMIRDGVQWLADNVNDDGGWGDTVVSKSNLSTTLLVWGALNGCDDEFSDIEKKASVWVEREVGGLEAENIAAAVTSYYGKDKTFSAPILAMLAMAGRLGSDQVEAWRFVMQLPFEFSVLPQAFFRWLRLPVVSYALPALIAIGVARHILKPSRNLFSRFVRKVVLARSLRVLEDIQPTNGGFLEATPLTGFVVMSLAAAGYKDSVVVRRGAEFLVESVRSDGSWAIDSDLATWVTALAVNAVDVETDFNAEMRADIKSWLLNQQFREKHPFTGAAPGGWGWTDLPGSVPDADDTAGALLALKKLSARDDAEVKRAATAGLEWLLGVQNRDGGVPTFCKGWGMLPFDMSCPDITAHAIHAISAWEDCMDKKVRHRLEKARQRMISYLKNIQRMDGAWIPLWFGNEDAAEGKNLVYGTARVLVGVKRLLSTKKSNYSGKMVEDGCRFLCDVQNDDGGWGGDGGVESSIEETSLAVSALAGVEDEEFGVAAERGRNWLLDKFNGVDEIKSKPIGLYFASLWYYEDMYPLVFSIGALKSCYPQIKRINAD